MYPCWLLGASILFAVSKTTEKHLLRVEKKPVIDWCVFLMIVTALRVFLLTAFGYTGIMGPPTALSMIPWYASFTVFWEDACHGLPLVILAGLIGTKKRLARIINALAMFIVSVAFGMSHLYQGLWVALLLCLYVSYSIKYAKKYGFGTVIICHIIFDLVTFLYVKYLLGI